MKRFYLPLLLAAAMLAGCSNAQPEPAVTAVSEPQSGESSGTEAPDTARLEELLGLDTERSAALEQTLQNADLSSAEEIPYSGSLAESFGKMLLEAESFRVVMRSDAAGIEIAAAGKDKTKMSMLSGAVAAMIILDGNTLYTYEPESGYAGKLTCTDESVLSEYSRQTLIKDALRIFDDGGAFKRVPANAGGKSYTVEAGAGKSFLFDENGMLAAISDGTGCFTVSAKLGSIPDKTFSLPEGTAVIDYDSFIEQAVQDAAGAKTGNA